jgi:beta-fructofuranosidase
MWECPQLFPLGDRHILLISVWSEGQTHCAAYVAGDFDGRRFTPATRHVLDPGALYAPQTFADERGRRVLFGWLREGRSRAAPRAGWPAATDWGGGSAAAGVGAGGRR